VTQAAATEDEGGRVMVPMLPRQFREYTSTPAT
jgi:hypothetical protein